MMFKNLRELLIYQLEDLFSAEKMLVEALPKAEKEATTPELKEALHKHFQETKEQVERLKKAFQMLKVKPQEEKCKAMQGLLAEVNEVLKNQPKSALKDAAIIEAAQKVEHYEISGYGTAIAHAKLMELDEIVDLLKASQDEEYAADKKLTKIAEGTFFTDGINQFAMKK